VNRGKSKVISSREFILCVWLFLTRDSTSMAMFTFDTYCDRVGIMTKAKLKQLLIDADGANGVDKKLMNLLVKMNIGNHEDQITFKEFEIAIHISPILMRPVAQLQTKMKEMIIGKGFWNKRHPL
jgi:hypothetical protein